MDLDIDYIQREAWNIPVHKSNYMLNMIYDLNPIKVFAAWNKATTVS